MPKQDMVQILVGHMQAIKGELLQSMQALGGRMDRLELRMDRLDRRMGSLEGRMGSMEHKVSLLSVQIDNMDKGIDDAAIFNVGAKKQFRNHDRRIKKLESHAMAA